MSNQNSIDLEVAFSIADWKVFNDKNGRCFAMLPNNYEFRVLSIRSLAFAEELLDLMEWLDSKDRPVCLVKSMLSVVEEMAKLQQVGLCLEIGEIA